jgi:hypothetical protein
MTGAADERAAIRQLNARYGRFLDAKDVESRRNVFSTDVVVTLTSPTTATGIWAMEDLLVFGFDFGRARELHGAGHHHETYEKHDGRWRIKTLHLTRTLLKMSGV